MEYDENRALVAIAHMKLSRVVAIDRDHRINGARISMEKKIPGGQSDICHCGDVRAMVYTGRNTSRNFRTSDISGNRWQVSNHR